LDTVENDNRDERPTAATAGGTEADHECAYAHG
jgi:hypothetical protein